MKGDEAALSVDACAHGLGRANEDADAAGIDVSEELLFGGGFLEILHESDLGRCDAELDETGLDPTVAGLVDSSKEDGIFSLVRRKVLRDCACTHGPAVRPPRQPSQDRLWAASPHDP